MLSGIGGRTIAEAKNNLSYVEFLQWVSYRNKYGSLPIASRIEFGIANLSAMYGNLHSKQGSAPMKAEDFMLREEREISEEEAMRDWW